MNNPRKQIRPQDKWIFVGLLSILLAIQFAMHPWQNKPFNHQLIQWDNSLYYVYLPAVLIYQDPGIQKQWPIDFDDYQITLNRKYKDRFVYKMTSGMAWMYLPGFLAGHACALVSSNYEPNGFSLPYQMAISLWIVVLSIIGCWFLYHFLNRFVTRNAAMLTIFVLAIGTNLLYYIGWESAAAHASGFALISICLELAYRFSNQASPRKLLLFGFLLGLVVLVRPVNIFIALFIFGLFLKQSLGNDLKAKHVVWMAVGGAIPWLLQVGMWFYTTNQFYYYGYGEERFFWGDPQIVNGLFSWRKGWIVYTPIMVFAIIGFYPFFKSNRPLSGSIFLLFAFYIYLNFSWWCWWYGGSYGQRSMIDLYPLLAIPLAFFFQWLFKTRVWIKAPALIIVVLLSLYNVFTSWQAAKALIHYESMTKEAYKAVFLKTKWPQNYYQLLDDPDYQEALEGKRDQ